MCTKHPMKDQLLKKSAVFLCFFERSEWVFSRKPKIFSVFALFYLFILFSFPVQAQSADHLLLHQGSLKLIRDGQSHFLWKSGLKLRLLPGDKLHTGSRTRVSLKLQQGTENIELFSHAFFAVEGIAEDQRSVALLVGKGNFALPPAHEMEEEDPIQGSSQNELSEEDQEVNSEKVDAGSNEDETTTGEEQGINQEKKVPSEQNKKEDLKKSPVKRGNKKLARIAKRKSGGLRSRKKRFKVRTVSAVVGVRGTEFVVAAADDSTNVLTVTGEVTLASAELPGYEVVLPKSNVSRVSEGSAPSEPVAVPPAEQQQIVESGSTEGFQEVEFGPAQALDAVQESESGQPEEAGDLEGGEEISILDQLETLDEIQQMIDSAENAINLSQTRILILKTNITPR